MIRINLLPYRTARKKENVRQQVSIFLLIIVFLTISLVWYNNRLNGKIEALNGQIEFTRKEVARYNKIAKEVEELKNKLALLKRKLQVIEQLDMNRERSFRLLDELTKVVVEKKMWITELEAKQEEKKRTGAARKRGGKDEVEEKEPEEVKSPNVNIKIQGIALDNKTVADFMTRLEKRPFFKNVKLINLQQELFKQGKDKEDIHLKRFVVSCMNPPLESIASEGKEET